MKTFTTMIKESLCKIIMNIMVETYGRLSTITNFKTSKSGYLKRIYVPI